MKRETQVVLVTTKAAAAALKRLAKQCRRTQQALLREALSDLGRKYEKNIPT